MENINLYVQNNPRTFSSGRFRKNRRRTEILFADSTPYSVCKAARRFLHKVFKGITALSKNSVGWFFELKLHFVFNDRKEILGLSITSADVDERKRLRGFPKAL